MYKGWGAETTQFSHTNRMPGLLAKARVTKLVLNYSAPIPEAQCIPKHSNLIENK